MKIKISNININNSHLINRNLGIAGYAASEREDWVDTSFVLNLGDDEFRKKAEVTDEEIGKMIFEFMKHGFSVQRT